MDIVTTEAEDVEVKMADEALSLTPEEKKQIKPILAT